MKKTLQIYSYFCYNYFNNLIVEANAALFASVGLMMSYYLQKQEEK